MSTGAFEDPATTPGEGDLKKSLAGTYAYWKEINDFVNQNYPEATIEWKYAGKNYGWSFRLKDKKRVIIYLLPKSASFMASMVFGEKAMAEIIGSDISEQIKAALQSAKVYAEGRGIRLEVDNGQVIEDIKKLILIKLKY